VQTASVTEETRVTEKDEDETAPPEPVSLTVPSFLLDYYRKMVEGGVYLSLDEALRQAILDSFRFQRGSFHRIRLDVGPDEVDEPGDDGAADPDAVPAPDQPAD
jgi:Arc/MetJ-type ribon-helix-helix transcriptional regulator